MSDSSPFDFFDEIYCLTTESREKTYERALREFTKIGIADRVIKFNGSKIDLKIQDQLKNKSQNHFIPANASHLEIWKYAINKGAENVLIFEDDVTFFNWNNEALSDAIKTLKTNEWELFYIGYLIYAETVNYKHCSQHLVEVEGGSDIRSTHAYCISKRAYQKIQNYDPFNDKVVDQYLPDLLKMHCLIPLMSAQNQIVKRRFRFLPTRNKMHEYVRNANRIIKPTSPSKTSN